MSSSQSHNQSSGDAIPDQIAKALNDSARADIDKVAIAVGTFYIGAFATICAFEALRRKNKKVYEPKRKYADTGRPAPPDVGYSFFGWIEPVWSYTEEQMLETAGLDAVVFLRFMRLCCYLTTLLALLLAATLIPIDIIYNLRVRSSALQSKTTKLSIMTLAEMYGSYLYAHIAMSYVCCGVSLFLIFRNYQYLVGLRWAFFRSEAYQRSFASRTLLLTNVNKQLQSDVALQRMLSTIGLPYPTTDVHIGRDMGALPKLIEDHDKTVRQLERVLAKYLQNLEKKKSPRPTMRVNKSLLLFGGNKVDAIEYLTSEINKFESVIKRWRDRIGERDTQSFGFASMAAAPFAHAAAKALKGKRPYQVEATLAPEPRDILWTNLPLTKTQRFHLNATGFVYLVVIVTINAIPLLAANLIAQMSTFTNNIPQLKQWQNESSLSFNAVAAIIPPGISIVLSWFVPFIMRKIAKYRGERTRTDLDKAVTAQYFAFQLISQFILFSILGILITSSATVIDQISLHKSAGEVFKTLRADTVVLKKQFLNTSNYWLTWLPMRLWQSTYELSQGHRLILAWIRSAFLGKTPRDARDYAKPPKFEYAINYGDFLFVFAVGLAYGCLVPLVMVFTAITFWVSLGCYKYNIMYVNVSKVESGGGLWRIIVNRLFFCLIFMQLVLMCIVSLDDTVSLVDRIVKASLCLPPIAVVLAFKAYCSRRFDQQFDWYLPESDEMASLKIHTGDQQRHRLQRRFGHPCLHQEIFTPMVHAKVRHLLPTAYNTTIGKRTSIKVAGQQCETHEVTGGLQIAALNDSQLEYDPRLDSDAQSVFTTTTMGPISGPRFASSARQGTMDSIGLAQQVYLAGGDFATTKEGSLHEMTSMSESRMNLLAHGFQDSASGMVTSASASGNLRSGLEYPAGSMPPHYQHGNAQDHSRRAAWEPPSAYASTIHLDPTSVRATNETYGGMAYPFSNAHSTPSNLSTSRFARPPAFDDGYNVYAGRAGYHQAATSSPLSAAPSRSATGETFSQAGSEQYRSRATQPNAGRQQDNDIQTSSDANPRWRRF